MTSSEGELVTRLLKQSILTLCRETVSFQYNLEIDGIICIAVDKKSQHVVKLHEIFIRELTDGTNDTETELKDAGSHEDRFKEIRKSSNPTVHVTKPLSPCEVKAEPMEECDVPKSPNEPLKSENEHISETETTEKEIEKAIDPAVEHSIRANISAMQSVSKHLEKLTVSKAKNISCKKCSEVLENVSKFETHNMMTHGHFTCLVCLATFTSRNNMKRHIRLHTGIKPYTCHKCPESFARNDDFKRHLLRHSYDKPFRCAVCKTGYSDRSCVKNHMIKEHHSKIFHICPQCGESFIDSQKFQQHKKTHPEFQDYRCSLCSFTGSNALMYNKHMLTHGPLKKYLCSHCDLSFRDPFVYTGHLKKHKGDELVQSFGCCFCDMKLQSYDQFQRHEHSHIQARQHTCNVCQKQFRYPSNLREHMLTHIPKSAFSGQNETELYQNLSHFDFKLESTSPDKGGLEENNNTIELADKDDIKLVEAGQDCSGSNEYWCTECNQGFSTEGELHEHIGLMHEHAVDDVMVSVKDRKIQGDSKERKEPKHVPAGYPEDIHGVFNSNTQCEKNVTVYDEHTQLDEYKSPAGKRPNLADSVMNVDRKDTVENNPEFEAIDMTKKSSARLSTFEMQIMKDAMRQVQNIQARLGIISDESDAGSSSGATYMADESTCTMSKRAKLSPSIGYTSTSMNRKKRWNERKQSSRPCLEVHSVEHKGVIEPPSPVKVTFEGMKMKIRRESLDPSEGSVKSGHTDVSPRSTDSLDDSNSDMTNTFGKNDSRSESLSPAPNHYSKTSVLGMDTEFSSAPNRNSPTTLNLHVRNPGFEKVVTPEVLFSTKAPFTCEVCEETFLDFESLDSHGVSVHRRYICSFCGKAFTSRPNRERHVRYHTGEKPYKCDLCTASFIRGDDLKYHRTTKHANIKPFTCAVCRSAFAVPKDLEKHLRVYPDHRL